MSEEPFDDEPTLDEDADFEASPDEDLEGLEDLDDEFAETDADDEGY